LTGRTLRLVLGGLAALLILYAIVRLAPPADDRGPQIELTALLGGLDGQGVVAFRLTGPTDTFALSHAAGRWSVNGFPADTNAIRSFWSEVSQAKPMEVAATSPLSHRRLGVGEDGTWTLLVVRQPDDSIRLLVGRPGPLHPSTYVRMPERNEVHLVQGRLAEAVSRPLLYWRDRTVVQVDTTAVAALTISRGGSEYAVRRTAAGWRLGDAPADSATVVALLAELSNLQAVGFATDSTGYGEDRRRLIVLSTGADTLAVLAMRLGIRGQPLVTLRGSPIVFELAFESANRVAPERERLLRRGSQP
jgi:hypothetical protein